MKRHIANIKMWMSGTDSDNDNDAYHLALYNDSGSGATDAQVIENFLDDTFFITKHVVLEDFETGNTAYLTRR